MEQDMILNLTPEEKRKQESLDNHATYQVGDGYFMIEEHTEGWNYNFYDRNITLITHKILQDIAFLWAMWWHSKKMAKPVITL